jgi:hypothetical protein
MMRNGYFSQLELEAGILLEVFTDSCPAALALSCFSIIRFLAARASDLIVFMPCQ